MVAGKDRGCEVVEEERVGGGVGEGSVVVSGMVASLEGGDLFMRRYESSFGMSEGGRGGEVDLRGERRVPLDGRGTKGRREREDRRGVDGFLAHFGAVLTVCFGYCCTSL